MPFLLGHHDVHGRQIGPSARWLSHRVALAASPIQHLKPLSTKILRSIVRMKGRRPQSNSQSSSP
jgi:hypothetical protein